MAKSIVDRCVAVSKEAKKLYKEGIWSINSDSVLVSSRRFIKMFPVKRYWKRDEDTHREYTIFYRQISGVRIYCLVSKGYEPGVDYDVPITEELV